jgi:hypothetical protein
MMNSRDKIALFRELFTGLDSAYGTYDLETGRSRQVKALVTPGVMLDHLTGRKPYGVYLLVKEKTGAVAVDFDNVDRLPVMEFVGSARHYSLEPCVEVSKSRGYHAWIFFREPVPAWKARTVVRNILEEIGMPGVEVFPKQDSVADGGYGNFINAPLFGRLVPKGRTVFVSPETFEPYPSQWDFLKGTIRHPEQELDDIIEMNGLESPEPVIRRGADASVAGRFGLPPCSRKMLSFGVASFRG